MRKGTKASNPDIERRRLAIIRALRGEAGRAATPPVVNVDDARLQRLEAEVAAVRMQVADLSATLRHLASRAEPPEHRYPGGDMDHEDAGESPRVPPVEPAGGMSRRAAEALFGY